jgi:hypothetical protein
MPLTTLPAKPPHPSRSHRAATARPPIRAARVATLAVLARYTDSAGRQREVLALPGHGGSVLVLDRDAATWGDRRLLAHLAADEPLENARLVCGDYLRDPRPRRCRRLAPEDLRVVPFEEEWEPREEGVSIDPLGSSESVELCDRHGVCHRLEAIAAGRSVPELRWCRRESPTEPGHDSVGRASGSRPESVRDVVACMDGYEPVRALTARALAHYRNEDTVSVTVLRNELQRIDASRIVLNRGLRRAVLHALRTQRLSLSEIAFRCGRVKCDGKGNRSGETSWLSRRVGIAPESGGDGQPTPWIHSEVLALIAREGLGISPREVEL